MIHELITKRRSIRSFSERRVDDETLLSLFEAARWASSSRNEQPWRFIVARQEEKETFEKISSCLNESNRIWAQHGAFLIVVLAKKDFTSHNTPNHYTLHDTGLAIGNLSLQATYVGIFLHQMAGINADKIRTLFEVPDDFEVVSVIVGGYPGNPDLLPENLRLREIAERHRKNPDEIIFSHKFGEKSLLFNHTEK